MALDEGMSFAPQPLRAYPQDEAAERALLSCLMMTPAARELIPSLLPEHFFSEKHRRVFEAMLSVPSPDVVTLGHWLRDQGRIDQVGGMPGLTEIVNAAPVFANAPRYADIVRDLWRRRQAMLGAQRMVAELSIGLPLEPVSEVHVKLLESLAPKPVQEFEILSGEALAVELPEPEYLVREVGLVAGAGPAHMFAGYGYSGKTVALQSLLLSLATGCLVWGAYPCRPKRVLHVDLEQGRYVTVRRYQRMARALGIPLGAFDTIHVAIKPEIQLTARYKASWKRLMDGRDLMVIDSLKAGSKGLDENDSRMRDGLDMLGGLSEETGCRPLVVHHAAKGGGDDDERDAKFSIRGSGAIFDALDGAWVFAGKKGEPVSVVHEKIREGETVDDFALTITDFPRDDNPKWGLAVRVHGHELVVERRAREKARAVAQTERDVANRVCLAVKAQPGISTRDLRALARVSGDGLTRALLALKSQVEARQTKDGRSLIVRHFPTGGP
jgi:AAA domain/DnaB-like helicase N terminal domain